MDSGFERFEGGDGGGTEVAEFDVRGVEVEVVRLEVTVTDV